MPTTRVAVLAAVIVLVASACGGSAGFALLDGRDALGVDPGCVDLADEYLLAAEAYLEVLAEVTFEQWVAEGVFHVEGVAPEVAATMDTESSAYDAAGCPGGFLATMVLAHADRLPRASAPAAIWWAGIAADAARSPYQGAADEAQTRSWVEFIAARDRDVSGRAEIPSANGILFVPNCAVMAEVFNDIFQQQIYLLSGVPFLEDAGPAMADLEQPLRAAEAQAFLLDCRDLDLREAFLREAHGFEVAGPGAVVAFASEVDRVFAEYLLSRDFGIVARATMVDPVAGTVELILRNGGDVRMRFLNVAVNGLQQEGPVLDLRPGEGVSRQITVQEVPPEGLTLEIQVQRPDGDVTTERLILAVV